MKTRAYISGSLVWEGDLDCVPPIGTSIILALQSYKKGLWPGTVLSFSVTADDPPTLDLTEDPPVLTLDVNGWSVLSEGPVPPDEHEALAT